MADSAGKEKNCYRYHDTRTEVWADPMVVYRRLAGALDGDVAGAIDAVQVKLTPGPAEEGKEPTQTELPHDMLRRLAGEERLAAAARQAFSLPPFDPQTGDGATDQFSLDVVYNWLEWVEKNDERAAT